MTAMAVDVNEFAPDHWGLKRRVFEATDRFRQAEWVISVDDLDDDPGVVVWVSGMNQTPGHKARRIAAHLSAEGFIVDLVRDDGAVANGGLEVPVKGYRLRECSCGGTIYMVYNRNGNGTATHVPTPNGSHPPMLSKHV